MTDDDDDDRIPTCGEHRGVPLHAGQSRARLKRVAADIDTVLAIDDADALFEIACDPANAPESRLLAQRKLEALWDIATEARANRPHITIERIRAAVAGCGSRRWRSPDAYCSDLDWRSDRAVRREQPLQED